VVRTIDVGTLPNGTPYLVMELLEGEDLAQALERRGAMPEQVAIGYVLQALVALAEAHALGIVHRDLKPSNLFLATQPDGSTLLKVLDFGISKVRPAPGMAPNLTVTGGLLGSPLYMSPEQIRSAKLVDQRSDLWSMGVILHELVTGRPPFTAEQVPGVLAAIVADAPMSVRSVRPDLSHGLEAVVLRCLSKDTRARFASAAEVAQALAPLAAVEDRAMIRRIIGVSGGAGGSMPPAERAGAAPSRELESPTSAAATAQGWVGTERPRDSRVLRRTAFALAGALAVGGALLWARMKGSTSLPLEAEAHSAAPRNDPAVRVQPAPPKPPEPIAADVPPPKPVPSVTPVPTRHEARPAVVARPKSPAQAKVKAATPPRPKPSGPRDPSELIDDRR
jgi:serine/threonine-protein kinase